MKKKTICVFLCMILVLIFASSSFGGFDPKACRLRERPDQELTSPSVRDELQDVLLMSIPNWIAVSLLILSKGDSRKETQNLQNLATKQVKCTIGIEERTR